MKKFENPMLQMVSISKHDIITTSGERGVINSGWTSEQGAPGQRGIDSWYEGY